MKDKELHKLHALRFEGLEEKVWALAKYLKLEFDLGKDDKIFCYKKPR